MKKDWKDDYIVEKNGEFIVWDEIHYSEVGRGKTRQEAEAILIEYADSLENEIPCIGCKMKCKINGECSK